MMNKAELLNALAVEQSAVAVVFDRATAQRPQVEKFGGAWLTTFDTWQKLDAMPYLVMLAHTGERISQRAPLCFLARHEDGLRVALRTACQELSGKKCLWGLCVAPGSNAETITRTELLLGAAVGGHA